MKVILLCAGYATRLYPLTKNRPKPLLDIAGKPIIDYFLEALIASPVIDHVYVVTNRKFYSIFRDWHATCHYPFPIKIIDNGTTNNDNRLGAIGDEHFVISQENIEDDVLIMGGDNLFAFNSQSFFSYANEKKPAVTIGTYDVKEKKLASHYGVIHIDPQHNVRTFEEKPSQPTSTLASLALYFYPKEMLPLLDRYVATGYSLDQPGLFIAWLVEHHRVVAYPMHGHWFDIGDFASLEHARTFYATL